MTKDLNKSRPSGSKRLYEPRVIGDIINEMLLSNEPLAVALRNWIADREANKKTEEQSGTRQLFIDFFPHTELGIDLKLITLQPERMPVGSYFNGVLTHDSEYHFTFHEALPTTAYRRNPRVFDGKYITITRKKDGSLQPNFKPLKKDKDFSATAYASGVANELLWALSGLIEKEAAK